MIHSVLRVSLASMNLYGCRVVGSASPTFCVGLLAVEVVIGDTSTKSRDRLGPRKPNTP